MLHKKCGTRLKQQCICPKENEVVTRDVVADPAVSSIVAKYAAIAEARTVAAIVRQQRRPAVPHHQLNLVLRCE